MIRQYLRPTRIVDETIGFLRLCSYTVSRILHTQHIAHGLGGFFLRRGGDMGVGVRGDGAAVGGWEYIFVFGFHFLLFQNFYRLRGDT